jgi:hypothetical protein
MRVIVAILAGVLLFVAPAKAQETQSSSASQVIRQVFGSYGTQAVRVAACESGLSVWARNGEHLGLFQMGAAERRIYGHGWNAWAQARAAYRYFVASGRDWSPWQCKPW